jgi:hypothetical protein
MSEFDIEAFLAELDRLGMRLTALRLADGSLKIYRWRMSGARDNAREIEKLWNSTIGPDRTRNDLVAEHLLAIDAKRGPNIANKPPTDAGP